MECLTPLQITNKTTKRTNKVPCQKCPFCLKRRASAWCYRLMQEYNSSSTTSAHFITLTYDTQHVPITKNGFMELRKCDVQKFFKRLRKRECGSSRSPISYFIVGEYGGRTRRPHYHALIFNVRELRNVQLAWKWGQLHYGQVTEASVGYTMKYMMKENGYKPMHRNDDRQPQFALMSKVSVRLI